MTEHALLSSWRATWVQQLRVHSDNAEQECTWIIAAVTGLKAGAQRSATLTAAQQARIQHLITRRAAGVPLAYVLGSQPFWTLELQVNPSVLIPRADTEVLVQRALTLIAANTAARVADLGTGSGAIALALAHERPQWRLLATDIDAAALTVARANAEQLKLGNVSFYQGDWCAALPAQRLDMLISNPPYIAHDDPDVTREVRNHEPHHALFAGTDGLQAIRQLIAQAPAHLRPHGWLLLEHGWRQAPAVRALLESAGWVGVASHADLAGHQRVTEARWPGQAADQATD